MKKIYYAKSEPKETIKEHTERLLRNLKLLKDTYEYKILEVKNIDKDRFFYLLEIVCQYHDIGKVFTPFQNIILHKIGEKEIETQFTYQVKHEQLSPMFIPIEKLGLSSEERKVVYQAIYYHHERDKQLVDNLDGLVSKIIEEDIKPQLEEIKKEMQIAINEELSSGYLRYVKNRITQDHKLYNEYCLLKGLLHRLDHSSSSSEVMNVEEITNEKVSDFVKKSITDKNYELNDLQIFAEKNQNKNMLVIGSTGIGKTEAALLWSNQEKTFFTLPIRISINAIYDRIKENMHYQHVGLLHSTALEYLENKQEFENEENVYEQTKNLYPKIITCTIDQIFPFVFKYKGYEKIYATLAYSKIIIDEIQAYSPEIVAVILKGIQMLHNIGGMFMIMTATLPRIYKEEMEKMGIDFEYNEFIKQIVRHRIKMQNMEILEDLESIQGKSRNSKVLIIVNTVNKAIEVYEKLKKLESGNINLLHSRFIAKDRNKKEDEIRDFSKDRDESGIWITTQIVEASLDIDFDYLYTEMSTLDSLFQRLGRCFRSREYNGQNPNVYVYIKNSSGIGKKGVYNEQIHNNSIQLLEEYDEKILEEKDKIALVDKLYSNEMLKGTQFLKDFEAGMQVLENIIDYNVSKSDAQKLLRNIENVTVMPKSVYEEKMNLFEDYKMCKDIKKKNEIKREIRQLTTSISMFQANKLRNYITEIPNFNSKDILMIDMKYDNEKGLMLEESKEDDWDKRSF